MRRSPTPSSRRGSPGLRSISRRTFLRTEPVSGVALERFRPGAYADYQYEAGATRARFRLDVHNGYADVSQNDVYVESNVRHSRSGRNGRIAFKMTNGSVGETRFRAADSMWAVVSRILTIGEFRVIQVTENTGERRIPDTQSPMSPSETRLTFEGT